MSLSKFNGNLMVKLRKKRTEIHGRILVVDDNRKELKIDPKLREIPE